MFIKYFSFTALLLTFSFITHAQSVSSGVVELRVPVWSLIDLDEKQEKNQKENVHHVLNLLAYHPGKPITIEFKNGDRCVVEVSRIQDRKLLVDISECDHVLEITQLIPSGARLKREYAPLWYRPISEQERLKFPLNVDGPLVVGRLPSQERVKVSERTSYKALFRNNYQHWYKIKNRAMSGWVPADELIFAEDNTNQKIMEKLNRIRIKIIKDRRQNKNSPGWLLEVNYQARLNNISEEDNTTKNKLGYVQNSYMTVESHYGYIRYESNQQFTGRTTFSYNNSNDGLKIPIAYSTELNIGSLLGKDFVARAGTEYEYVPSFNVGELNNQFSTKEVINNTFGYVHLELEKKIFSLTDIATELGLHRSPMAKSLFRLLDHSFYFRIRGSYLVYDKTDHPKPWQGLKIYSEITSKVFKNFNVGAFYQMTSLKGVTNYAGQRLGILLGYSFF